MQKNLIKNSDLNKEKTKIANPNPIKDSPPSNPFQDPPTMTTSSQSNQPQPSIRISFVENRSFIEPLIPAICHAPLIEPQHEPNHSNYPALLQELNRTRHSRQNDAKYEIQTNYSTRRERNLTTPRVQFKIHS